MSSSLFSAVLEMLRYHTPPPTRSPCHPITSPPDHLATRSPCHPITLPPDHLATRSPFLHQNSKYLNSDYAVNSGAIRKLNIAKCI
ncbi:hypothetical protein B0T26DRAFT_497735 [Lasiosphaeria miniovina]|uniref:Uncharacterized protein n=1 Tax=Lasiosphaeria miniovina TaxID=1954250 RepID=A0AA39ZTV0_9PEZI|nr:uncharacterized protein B0T26DRAFT_497735 [Lasiosphaeria miniovina]KAK0703419.1 hypothetical protein B0T26DRAFT_497735 [Lasiosphaeria miniovina]